MSRKALISFVERRIRESEAKLDVKLDPTDVTLLTSIAVEFLERLVTKYVAGKKKHGGVLTDRNTLAEAKDEAIDLWTYLCATDEKIRRFWNIEQQNHEPTRRPNPHRPTSKDGSA